MDLLRETRVRVHHSDTTQVRALLASRRLDGITSADNAAWWRLVVTFTITGPPWAVDRAVKDIERIHLAGLIRGW